MKNKIKNRIYSTEIPPLEYFMSRVQLEQKGRRMGSSAKERDRQPSDELNWLTNQVN